MICSTHTYLSFDEAVQEIGTRKSSEGKEPSIDPTRHALEQLGLIEKITASRVIVIAGTNGKGSVSAVTAQALRAAGYSVGLFTSPHLVRITERINVNGKDIETVEFARAYNAIRSVANALELSHFERLTVMAAWAFFHSEHPVDYAVFEVGLGGKFDPTNAIPHEHCVITTIGLDHENMLGPTLLDIARNKFGIVGSNASVIHHPFAAEIQPLALEYAARTKSRWTERPAVRFETKFVCAEDRVPEYILKSPWGDVPLSLPGRRGAENTMLALSTVQALGIDPTALLPAISKTVWPGRMQRIQIKDARCPVYVSGDHNVQGIQSLCEILLACRYENLHIVAGFAYDKNHHDMLTELRKLPRSKIYLTETPFKPRAIKDYGAALSFAAAAEANPKILLRQVFREAGKADLIIVTGSLYLVGELI